MPKEPFVGGFGKRRIEPDKFPVGGVVPSL